ncbi:MAG TPA: hypothetical protein VH107_06270 [Lacipirellulaceae bacterium]|nr:hypothetical protein [Lacipirellulaceae bacterium]
MLIANALCRRFVWVATLLIACQTQVWAAPPSDTLLPKTTKGYLSVAHPKEFQDRWNKTQLGELFNDETMQAFENDLRHQLHDEYDALERKLGLTLEELKGVTGGELSLAIIERKTPDAAMAITIDVTGHEKEAEQLLDRIEKTFARRGGKKSNAKSGDTSLVVFDAPADKGGAKLQTVYFLKDNLLCGVDDRAEAEAMLKRFDGNSRDNLKSVTAYVETMNRCQKQAGQLEPEARWFVEPFGFVFAARTLRKTQRHRDQDMAKIMYDNGFDAVLGAGGYVNQSADGNVEFLLRASVYAPPVKGKENDPLRWNLSMRMMQFLNAPANEPESWVPRMIANYTTVNMNLVDAFDNIGPLFDAVQDHEDAWKNAVEGWSTDPYGPQVDVRKEFIGNLTNRISVITSYDVPITENSERSVFAIEAKDEAAVAKTLEKWMKSERDVKRREVGEYVIWERIARSNAVEEPQVEVPGFTKKGSNGSKAPKKERENVLPNSAITVALGHLMLASDVAYMTEVLQGFGQRERLASSADYKQLIAAMDKVAPGDRSAWSFGRGDEEVRPIFELVRQNRMPESKSMVGKMLNNMLTTDADRKIGGPRKQQVDGSSLPEFESIRRYFGPHATMVRSEKDGWFITAAVMNTNAP